MSFAAGQYHGNARQDRIFVQMALHKGPVFRFCPDGHDLLLREGSKPLAETLRGSVHESPVRRLPDAQTE